MRMRTTFGLSLVLLVVSSAAIARQSESAPQQSVPSIKAKPSKTQAAERPGKRQRAGNKATARGERRARDHVRQYAGALPPADQYLGPVRVVGTREVGSAAWYGGRHIGMRTASGDRLDAVRATAAHRSLPLHSLVRVTNLKNGRSIIAKITDRGPVSRSLLIDLSPRCAEELDMKRSGIVTVAVEPVAPAPPPAITAGPVSAGTPVLTTGTTSGANPALSQVASQAASPPAR
jgi:rare lipoprotein A